MPSSSTQAMLADVFAQFRAKPQTPMYDDPYINEAMRIQAEENQIRKAVMDNPKASPLEKLDAKLGRGKTDGFEDLFRMAPGNDDEVFAREMQWDKERKRRESDADAEKAKRDDEEFMRLVDEGHETNRKAAERREYEDRTFAEAMKEKEERDAAKAERDAAMARFHEPLDLDRMLAERQMQQRTFDPSGPPVEMMAGRTFEPSGPPMTEQQRLAALMSQRGGT